jgi:hypothetical protein
MIKKILFRLSFVSVVVAVIGTSLENASAIPPFARISNKLPDMPHGISEA